MGRPPAIIVDIDGTLADASHRMHLFEQKVPDWPAFIAASMDDGVSDWCNRIIRQFKQEYLIIIITGRPVEQKQITLDWLKKVGIGYDEFYICGQPGVDDTRTKASIYKQHIEPRYHVAFALDDRLSVAKMWRSLGVVCLHCETGDYWEGK